MTITLNIILAALSFFVGLWWLYRMRQEKTLHMLNVLEYLFLVIFCTYSSIICMTEAEHNTSFPHIITHIIEDLFTLLSMPVIYNIVADITTNNVSKQRMGMSFLPALVFGVIIGALHLISIFLPNIHNSFIMFANRHLFAFVIFLQLLILGYAMLREFYIYKKKIFCYYVDIETTDFTRVHNIVICFFFTTIIAYIQLLFQRSSFDIDGHSGILLFVNLCIAVIVCLVGWNMSRISGETVVVDVASKPYTPDEIQKMVQIAGKDFLQETDKQVATKEKKEEDSSPVFVKEVPSTKDTPSTQAIEETIDRWTQRSDKPYLTEGISLAMAAEDMGLNVRILSVYLNTVLEVNFNAWINNLRIEEAKRILDSHSTLPVSVIAVKCGFADTSMLSKNFKKIMGMTITEYRMTNKLATRC